MDGLPGLPNEIVVMMFGFLSEADKRKLSVCSSLFCDIYQRFCSLLPLKVEISRIDFGDDKIINWQSWFKFEYFDANEKFFDILGTNPSILINVNNSLTLSILFKKDILQFDSSYRFPNLSLFDDFNITILETHDCKLKFTSTHSGVYYVDGCDLNEIHSIQKKPCVQCQKKQEYEQHCKKMRDLEIHQFRLKHDPLYAFQRGIRRNH